ncbi:MAG: acyl-CoA dehydratase activase [Planctomycetia bacterium]|nr:acyl-CoA dehydratase activase [Planctomycetia bacterium]
MITPQNSKNSFSPLRLGLDVGSTTIKGVIYDAETGKMVWCRYARHFSDVIQTLFSLVGEIQDTFGERSFFVAMTGSAGIGAAMKLDLDFVQEVVASAQAIMTFLPRTDVAIELGGEDAKITFFDESIDQRMNETCAGGTGAFIDQIAVTLKTDAAGVNDLASRYQTIYPIAARCGVFTKSDVTMLLNEGASREDVAASVLQAVVDQTIGGLACGRKIRGNIAFLGGPLHFLPELRKRFSQTLKLKPEEEFIPENAHFFVALGAALLAGKNRSITATELWRRVYHVMNHAHLRETGRLPALFPSEEEYRRFESRHGHLKAARGDFKDASGDLYLGIDAGSTTTKVVLMDAQSRILQSWYGPNEGEPIQSVRKILMEIYETMPEGTQLKNACVTGYGEKMIQAALGVDEGEVETLAHYKAASHFMPEVSFILDIGGQDIKCIYIKNKHVDKIILNEACSSGCGSFIETFAQSLGYNVSDFAQEGRFSQHPIDLGTRCTVFMNSKVKQAQKENASVSDISAGLAYSVAKNALYKVLKIADVSELGECVMVQGGTFHNAAVLRALEKLIGKEVHRVDISGIMGAYGAALIARERGMQKKENSRLISQEALTNFQMKSTLRRCASCENKCLISIHKFSGGRTFISGNKCERMTTSSQETSRRINLFRCQYDRLFKFYRPRLPQEAPLGEIGLPRVLNMYENYPFWFTLFHELGFRVVVSDPSRTEMYNKGLDSISSQTLCYPAKLVHGHVVNLIEKGVKRIFYPAQPLERREFSDVFSSYNCPVVGAYPEVIRLNVDMLREQNVEFISPFLPVDDARKIRNLLFPLLKPLGVRRDSLKMAVEKAFRAQEFYKEDVREMGRRAVEELLKTGMPAIILAGRPYHLDPLVHHGIPELIVTHGAAVLSGDAVAHLGKELFFPLQVVDQWGYHARLYRAATFTAMHPNFQMVQMTSFGCGLDAVTAEQVGEILAAAGKVHTLLKIDESTQLGAIKIRIRSLLSTMREPVCF